VLVSGKNALQVKSCIKEYCRKCRCLAAGIPNRKCAGAAREMFRFEEIPAGDYLLGFEIWGDAPSAIRG
jgi:hypothetical protein